MSYTVGGSIENEQESEGKIYDENKLSIVMDITVSVLGSLEPEDFTD